MAFWPFMMGGAAVLTLWGIVQGAAVVPALALLGYVFVRCVIMFTPDGFHEIGVCTSWLLIAAVMMYVKAWVPGFFYVLSGLTYPLLLVIGIRISYLGLSPVIAEVFAICALLSIGGGLYGMAHSAGDHSGLLSRLSAHSLGMASRKEHGSRDLG